MMDQYSIEVSPVALNDLKNATDYIKYVLMSSQAAYALADEFEAKVSELAFFPQKHQLADDELLASLGIRFSVVGNYLVLYTIDESNLTVHIVRFLYSKSNWLAVLKGGF